MEICFFCSLKFYDWTNTILYESRYIGRPQIISLDFNRKSSSNSFSMDLQTISNWGIWESERLKMRNLISFNIPMTWIVFSFQKLFQLSSSFWPQTFHIVGLPSSIVNINLIFWPGKSFSLVFVALKTGVVHNYRRTLKSFSLFEKLPMDYHNYVPKMCLNDN